MPSESEDGAQEFIIHSGYPLDEQFEREIRVRLICTHDLETVPRLIRLINNSVIWDLDSEADPFYVNERPMRSQTRLAAGRSSST